jgi:hypothetical protein
MYEERKKIGREGTQNKTVDIVRVFDFTAK